jgi:hypothetical protein
MPYQKAQAAKEDHDIADLKKAVTILQEETARITLTLREVKK